MSGGCTREGPLVQQTASSAVAATTMVAAEVVVQNRVTVVLRVPVGGAETAAA